MVSSAKLHTSVYTSYILYTLPYILSYILRLNLFNCEISLYLNWSANCFIMAGTIDSQVPTFAITNTKLYVPVVT